MWTVEYVHPDGRGATIADGEAGWQPDGTLPDAGRRAPAHAVERAAYLRTVQDWIIRPQLKGMEGVAGIDAIGGYVKQYHVQPDPRAARGAMVSPSPTSSMRSKRNNVSTGAGVRRAQRRGLCRARRGRASSDRDEIAHDRRRRARRHADPRPRRRAVGIGRELRTGSATRERRGSRGRHGADADRREQPHRRGGRRRAARRGQRTLPPDVRARPVLDRTTLVDADDPHRRDATSSRARSWSSSCSSLCSATCAPR